MNRLLFVFEGTDGVGKTTLSTAVAEELRLKGATVALRSFPGREPGTLGALVYRLHHQPTLLGVTSLAPVALQLLHVAAHLDAIERDIKPRLAADAVVLLDRYWWSTWAYGFASGADPGVLRAMIDLEREYWGEWTPAAVFLVERGVPGDPHLQRVREAYLDLAAGDSGAVRIDNSGDLSVSIQAVLAVITNGGPSDLVSASA